MCSLAFFALTNDLSEHDEYRLTALVIASLIGGLVEGHDLASCSQHEQHGPSNSELGQFRNQYTPERTIVRLFCRS